jgi:hypothetical protein
MMKSQSAEGDTVPLQSGNTNSQGSRKHFVYSNDNFVGCAGWVCCATGVLIFALAFGAFALPDLEDAWQWIAEECYVFSANQGCCPVSVQVALSSAPVCTEAAQKQGESPLIECRKRTRTIVYTASDDEKDANVWLLTHPIGQVSACYDNPVTNITSFDPPPDIYAQAMRVPLALSFIFFVAGGIFIPTFLNPKSVFGRILDSMGIRKREEEELEEGASLKDLSHTRSSSFAKDRSKSYEDLIGEGIVMEPSEQVLEQEESRGEEGEGIARNKGGGKRGSGGHEIEECGGDDIR